MSVVWYILTGLTAALSQQRSVDGDRTPTGAECLQINNFHDSHDILTAITQTTETVLTGAIWVDAIVDLITPNANTMTESVSQSQLPTPAPLASDVFNISSLGSSGRASGKRGLSYNDASLTDVLADSSLITWAYNWASSPNGSLSSNLKFIPTLWGLNDDAVSSWAAQTSSAISSGSKHLFSFNEPDVESQADLSPEDATAGYFKYINPFFGKAALGAPAVTNGEGLFNLSWLSPFFVSCAGGCLINFINIHWYGFAEDDSNFKSYVSNASILAQNNHISKLWITELRVFGNKT